MGSAPSKAARKLPKAKPSWAGSRVPATATAEPVHPRPERPLAFESKNEAIKRDAKDPHFMENLNQLGPVRVDHHMQTVRAANDMQNMYRSRIRSEAEAASLQSAKNRLLASSLTELLEARKSITESVELETLAKVHHIDTAILQRLGRVVNTPSIDESTVVRTTDERGEESLTMMAHWVDPALSRVQ
ncbi:hypothetical protein J3R82DRAFT_5617 [Butyriboletus roseoflavus]|nr:hypothetical protein J3R82DRAFT_5617 [Butyriboletus roseoflavus]